MVNTAAVWLGAWGSFWSCLWAFASGGDLCSPIVLGDKAGFCLLWKPLGFWPGVFGWTVLWVWPLTAHIETQMTAVIG